MRPVHGGSDDRSGDHHQGAPIVGMAHTLGLLEAVYMLAFVAVRPFVRFNTINAWLFVGLTFLSFYCNFAGVCMTVITGAGAGMYLPPWDQYVTDDPTVVNQMVGILLNLSAVAVSLPVMLAMGWFDKARRSRAIQSTMTVVTILMSAVMIWFTFLP